MDELIGARQPLDQFKTDRLPQIRMGLLLRRPENDRKHRGLGVVAEAGQLLERFLGFEPQAVQLSNHELHYIVGVSLRVNALEVPGPSCLFVIEHEQTFFGERVKKLNQEERIAGGFRSEEHTSELQSLTNLVCRLLLEKKKKIGLVNYWTYRHRINVSSQEL